MTVDTIKGAICKFFNNRAEFSGVKFIQSPTNSPAPVGCYIAVGCDAVQQEGQVMQPGPGAGFLVWEQVAELYFIEVEGAGDKLRRVRSMMEHPDFIAEAEKAGFSVWEPGDIMRVDTFDGDFIVRQWRFTVTVNFEDTEAVTNPTIATVETGFNVSDETAEGGANG